MTWRTSAFNTVTLSAEAARNNSLTPEAEAKHCCPQAWATVPSCTSGWGLASNSWTCIPPLKMCAANSASFSPGLWAMVFMGKGTRSNAGSNPIWAANCPKGTNRAWSVWRGDASAVATLMAGAPFRVRVAGQLSSSGWAPFRCHANS